MKNIESYFIWTKDFFIFIFVLFLRLPDCYFSRLRLIQERLFSFVFIFKCPLIVTVGQVYHRVIERTTFFMATECNKYAPTMTQHQSTNDSNELRPRRNIFLHCFK